MEPDKAEQVNKQKQAEPKFIPGTNLETAYNLGYPDQLPGPDQIDIEITESGWTKLAPYGFTRK